MATTRILKRNHGGYEILRHDSRPQSAELQDPLAFEQSIFWLQPLSGLDFVRVAIVRRALHLRGPLLCQPPYLLLGYSRLAAHAPRDPVTGGYVRRMFYLKPEDSQLNMNQFPPEGLDPRTILPGVPGRPPSVAEWERGYPHYMCRAELGLPVSPVTMTAVTV
jgi:hypothetical protein